MEMIKNEFNEDWIKIEDSEIIQKFDSCLKGTDNLSTNYVAGVPSPEEIGNPHYVWAIHGGKNGSGRWNEYLVDLLSTVNKLKMIFNKVAILSIYTDIPDDVFDVRIVCGDRKIE